MKLSDLTKRQREILEALNSEQNEQASGLSNELVENGGQVWCGIQQTSYRLLNALLRHVLISRQDSNSDDYHIFMINESGKRLLAGETAIYHGGDGQAYESLAELFSKSRHKSGRS